MKEMRDRITEHKRKVQEEKSDRIDVFTAVLRSDLPPEEKATSRLGQEASQLVAAGTETTAWIQSAIIFYVLANREVCHKLCEELERAMHDPSSLPPITQLENLPYLISHPYPRFNCSKY